MKIKIFILLFCAISVSCFKNLIGSELEKCLRCICFATTYCNHLSNCVKAHITEKYWTEAGSPTLNNETPSPEAYQNCIKDTNCVLNTMDVYTKGKGSKRDANCDGKFDCKDRLAIHFRGLTDNYTLENYQVIRFDSCAVDNEIAVNEGWSPCDLKAISEVFS